METESLSGQHRLLLFLWLRPVGGPGLQGVATENTGRLYPQPGARPASLTLRSLDEPLQIGAGLGDELTQTGAVR